MKEKYQVWTHRNSLGPVLHDNDIPSTPGCHCLQNMSEGQRSKFLEAIFRHKMRSNLLDLFCQPRGRGAPFCELRTFKSRECAIAGSDLLDLSSTTVWFTTSFTRGTFQHVEVVHVTSFSCFQEIHGILKHVFHSIFNASPAVYLHYLSI